MAYYDHEKKTIRVTCKNCGDEIDVDVRADVEITASLTIKKD